MWPPFYRLTVCFVLLRKSIFPGYTATASAFAESRLPYGLRKTPLAFRPTRPEESAASSASVLVRNPKFKAVYDAALIDMVDGLLSGLKALSSEVLKRLSEIVISSKDEKVVFKVCDSIMDRIGVPKRERHETEHKGDIHLHSDERAENL